MASKQVSWVWAFGLALALCLVGAERTVAQVALPEQGALEGGTQGGEASLELPSTQDSGSKDALRIDSKTDPSPQPRGRAVPSQSKVLLMAPAQDPPTLSGESQD